MRGGAAAGGGAHRGSQSPPVRRDSRSPPRGRSPPRRSSRSPPRMRRSASRSPPREGGDGGITLYVAGLSSRVTEADLERTFSKFGKVNKTSLLYDPRTKYSRGFGFVTMEVVEHADDAIAHLNGKELEGRILTVEKSKRARPRSPTPGHYMGPTAARSGPDRYRDRYGYRPAPYSTGSRYGYGGSSSGGYGAVRAPAPYGYMVPAYSAPYGSDRYYSSSSSYDRSRSPPYRDSYSRRSRSRSRSRSR